jgi:hypothetical protein
VHSHVPATGLYVSVLARCKCAWSMLWSEHSKGMNAMQPDSVLLAALVTSVQVDARGRKKSAHKAKRHSLASSNRASGSSRSAEPGKQGQRRACWKCHIHMLLCLFACMPFTDLCRQLPCLTNTLHSIHTVHEYSQMLANTSHAGGGTHHCSTSPMQRIFHRTGEAA